MAGIFDPAIFDPAIFDTGTVEVVVDAVAVITVPDRPTATLSLQAEEE